MQTLMHKIITKLTVAFLLVSATFGMGLNLAVAYAASCSPTVTLDLFATTGTATLYGSTMAPVWGYSSSNTPGSAAIPGPALEVNAGDCVQVNLHNVNLPEATSLLFQGQALIPDTTGVTMGGSTSYVFLADSAGTFLYEAGLIPGAQHQVAMGMYGALIVRPAGEAIGFSTDNCSAVDGAAYGNAFQNECVLVLSELDPALNSNGNPLDFDMRTYNPQYFLINGKAYPDTAGITGNPGESMLMRYVNAGMQAHAMSTLGLSQTILAQDGEPYTYSHNVVAETIATGQTLDTIITVPASAADGDQFAIYDANMLLHNTTAAGFGGMMTFLTAGSGAPPPPPDPGPTVSGIGLSPNPTNGMVDVTVSATITDSGANATNIAAAEFYIDGTANTPFAMTAVDMAFDSTSEAVTGTIDMAITLAGLSSGNHTIFVRGQDGNGNWGPFLSIILNLDKTGPATTGLSLNPNPSDGTTQDVTLSATGDDTTTGGSDVTAAEYWVDGSDPGEGLATAMTLNGAVSSVTNFTATISPPISQGSHVVSVRSQDAFGKWGAVATINLLVGDTTPPTTSNVVAAPNPNNGSQGFNTSTPAVRVTADFSDVLTGGSDIVAAEGFIDTVGTTGTGFVFIPTDGSFNSPTESGRSDIPLAVIGSLSNGNHTIYVHAKDAAGWWSDMATTILVINKSLYFSTVGNASIPGVGGSADDADIYYWDGSFSRVIDASSAFSLPSNADVDGFSRVDADHFYMSFNGSVTLPGPLSVNDEDVVYYDAGTWSLYFDGSANGGVTANIDAISVVGGNLYFSNTGASLPGVGSGDDADIYRWNGGSSYTRIFDASALLWSTDNVDGFVWVDSTHFYISYSVDTTVPDVGSVQDEDVLYYNAGTWSVYFDGTANGLTNNAADIDAFDIP